MATSASPAGGSQSVQRLDHLRGEKLRVRRDLPGDEDDVGVVVDPACEGRVVERVDYVISLCNRVREVCPEFPGHPQTIHWSIPDPAAEPGSDGETYPAFGRTVTELEMRIGYLLHQISQQEGIRS